MAYSKETLAQFNYVLEVAIFVNTSGSCGTTSSVEIYRNIVELSGLIKYFLVFARSLPHTLTEEDDVMIFVSNVDSEIHSYNLSSYSQCA